MKKLLLIFSIIFLISACSFYSAEETAPSAEDGAAIESITQEQTVPDENALTPEAAAEPAQNESDMPPAAAPESQSAPAEESEPSPQIISLDSGNLYFKPENITVKANQPVKVNYTNKGEHTFEIDELGVKVNLAPDSGTFSFLPAKTGTFQFYCGVGGHRQAGMYGTITVY